MRVLVVGATGYAGGAIASELVSRGHVVDGVSRQPDATFGEGVHGHQGSLTDLESIAALVERADAVVLAARASGIESDGQTYADAIERLVGLLDGTGTRLAVVGGAGTLREPGSDLRHMDEGHGGEAHPVSNPGESIRQAEVLDMLRRIDAPGLDWFYVSPPALFGSYAPGERRGTYRLGSDVLIVDENGDSHISGEDYALAFVDELETPAHHNERFTVGY